MPKLSSILRYTVYLLIALILVAVLTPYIFKDKIIAIFKTEINKNVNADVQFKDIDVSLISSFPDLRLSIDSLTVVGKDTFYQVPLYSAVRTSIDISIPSLMGDNPSPIINEILLKQPNIHIVILGNGKANYDISMSKDTAESKFQLALKSLEISDGELRYIDKSMDLDAHLIDFDHTSSGDLSADIFDLKTDTKAQAMTVFFDNMTYFRDVKTDLVAKIHVDLPKNHYSFKDNDITLNDLKLKGNGDIQITGDDVIMDIDFKSATSTFKSLLSIIPNAYTADFKNVKSSGNASITGLIKGVYNGVKVKYPAIDMKIKVDNGMFQYPTLPKSVSNVFADIHIKADKSDYSDMSVNIPTFKSNIGTDKLAGRLLASNVTTNQKLDGFLQADINLQNIKSALPMQELDILDGLLKCDLTFSGNMKDISEANLDKVKLEGGGTLKSFVYKSKNQPKITSDLITAKANPALLNFDAQNLQFGNSDASIKGHVSNPLAVFSTNASTQIAIKGKSNKIDLNEWMAAPVDNKTKTASAPSTVDMDAIKSSVATINYEIGQILYDKHAISNANFDGKLSASAFDIQKFSATIEKSDFDMSGAISNPYAYLFENGILDGNIILSSKNFDANQFMTPAGTTPTTVSTIIPVPERVRLKVDTKIEKLQYTNLALSDFEGVMDIYDNEVKLTDIKTNGLGGSFMLNGLYNTRDLTKPDFQVKLDIIKVSFLQAVKNLETFKKLMPIAEFINGVFNTTLVMNGQLGQNMSPVLSSIDASGFLETITGAIKGYKPVAEMADKMGISELKSIDFTNTKNWFEIVDGTFELKPYNRKISGIDMTLAGKHNVSSGMDYNFDFVIPKEKIKKSKIGSAAISGFDLLHNEAKKYGVSIDNGPDYFVNVKLSGSFANPSIKITPKTSAGQTVGDAVKTKANEVVATIKDTVTKEIKKREEQLRDTVTKRANQELEKAKAKANEHIDRVVDSLKNRAKDKAIDRLDTLASKVVNDSLRKKARDILDKTTSQEVDKIKDKIKDFNPFKKKGKG